MTINGQTYVDEAQRVIAKLIKEGQNPQKTWLVNIVSTSKLRNLLAMTSDIYNQILSDQQGALSAEIQEKIEYLRVRFVYEAGREDTVRKLVQEAKILENLGDIKGDKKKFLLFSRYMEALVAFLKYEKTLKNIKDE